MSRRKRPTTVYLDPEQLEALHALNAATRVPIAEYIREGVTYVLNRYKDAVPPKEQA